MKRIISLCCVLFLVLCIIPFNAFAENDIQPQKINKSTSSKIDDITDYGSYNSSNIEKNYAKNDILLDSSKFSTAKDVKATSFKDDAGKEYKDCIVNEKDGALAEYVFTVAESGLYNFSLLFAPAQKDGNPVKVGLKIDGKAPFSEAQSVELPRIWANSTEVKTDSLGNQYIPAQDEISVFSKICLYDESGAQVYPYLFYLTKGTHKLTLGFEASKIAVAQLGFTAPENVLPYKEVAKEYASLGYKPANSQKPIIIEAENAVCKNSMSVVPKSDCNSPVVTPSDPVKELINYIGGANWKNPNEEIIWEFEVEKDGLYNLGLSFKQDRNMNSFAYRYLKIDGKTPFSECASLKFDYDVNWSFSVLGEDEPYSFYLTKGKHNLSLAATLGETATIYEQLKNCADDLGDLYLDITMITGETPDSNRDYELHNQVPQFVERLRKYKKTVEGISAQMKKISSGRTTSFTAALNDMARVLDSMMSKPFEAQLYVPDYYTSYSTVTSWLYDMKAMPLSIDRIVIASADDEISEKKVGFFEKISFSVKRFLTSFSEEYNIKKREKGTLNLWVNWGRDQAMVLNSLINEYFTPKTGIKVDLKITNASLLMGMLSGNAPDLSLHLARTEPLNLAMRGALYDLTQFSDYEDVITRFSDNAELPYTYKNGVYALPDTQSFYLMFYRKDVLDKLGIPVPNTWEEFLTAASVLQINNMDAYIPYTKITDASIVNAGVGGLSLYASILQQFGGEFYNDELNGCVLDSPVAFSAFKYWTDMYTKKKLPVEASFYNRFRSGTMPLGIDVYTMYTTLTEAAPEIQGRWSIALVPGTENEDGTINRTIAGAGTGCSIIKSSNNINEAWEFLKWWTQADTQLQYNNNVEAILGAVSRATTANIEAFSRMAWEKKDLALLLEQRSYIKEIPEVPGSYFVSRAVDQAFWNVVESNAQPKDTLYKWNNVCNNEIKRKIAEYSTDISGK